MKSLNSIKLLIATIVFALPFLGQSFQGEKNDSINAISYSITIDKANIQVAKVRVVFIPQDSLLYMYSGAEGLPKRWATFIHNLEIIDQDGASITVVEMADATWKMHVPRDKKVILNYEVHLEHGDYEWSSGIDGAAYMTELGLFYTTRALFILNGNQWKAIHVDFNLPKKWSVTTPWDSESATDHAFAVNDISDLATSVLFAGTHKEVVIKRDDFELVFALCSDEISAEEVEFRNLANGVLEYYIDLMGGIPNPAPNSPFKKVVVVIGSADETDGEAIGNNISILIKKNGNQFSKTISRFIFAHEFFHLWNGKSFRPNTDGAEWFKEGFSNYYTIKALHQVGFLNDESYLDILGSFFYQRYSSDEGVGTLSMAYGEEKHNHWGLIYGGGLFVGISQDIIIRKATNNEKSVDDLMRTLFKKYGGTNDAYTLAELRKTMSELSGIDQTDFFNTYILGVKKIPITHYLNIAGLNTTDENGNLVLSKKARITHTQQKILNGLFGRLNNN
jgi:predicted metalloprotease with PDZ domain